MERPLIQLNYGSTGGEGEMPHKDAEQRRQYHREYTKKHPCDLEKSRESTRKSAAKKIAELRLKEASMAPVLCECGCGKPVSLCTTTSKKRGMVFGEPNRFIRGHIFNVPQVAEKAAATHRMKGPLNPRWKANEVKPNAGRVRAQKIFNATVCSLCGKEKRLLRHHIDGNTLNNSDGNVIMICYSCHGLEHREVISIAVKKSYANRHPRMGHKVLP
jgi:hypothetical protein